LGLGLGFGLGLGSVGAKMKPASQPGLLARCLLLLAAAPLGPGLRVNTPARGLLSTARAARARMTTRMMGVSVLRVKDINHMWGGKDAQKIMYYNPNLNRELELEYGRQVQEGRALEGLRDEAEEAVGHPLEFDDWAARAGLAPETLAATLTRAREARHTMILSNLRLVASVAKRFQYRGLTYEELIQEGVLGVDRAVDLYDPSRGLRFSTYATRWIEQRVRNAIKRDGLHIRVPGRLVDLSVRIAAAERRLETELGRMPTDEEICGAANILERELRQVRSLPESVAALDEPSFGGIEDMIQTPEHTQPTAYAEQATLREDLETTLMLELTPSERDIVRLRVGLDDGKQRTFGEVAELLHLTRRQVVCIEQRAIEKLRSDRSLKRLDGHMNVSFEEAKRLEESGLLDATLTNWLGRRGRPSKRRPVASKKTDD